MESMKLNEVMEIAKWFNESNLSSFKWKEDETEIKFEKNNVITVAEAAINESLSSTRNEKVVGSSYTQSTVLDEGNDVKKDEEKEGFVIKSPVVGTFYSSPSPEEGSFVEVGQRVKKGDVVCIVEAMKLLNEITSPVDGVVKEIFVENESLLEFEQSIMRIEP